jgi:hypothetical protein
MSNKIQPLSTLLLFLSLSVNVSANSENSSSEQLKSNIELSDYRDYADYLNLPIEEYYKFVSAYGINNKSSHLPNFIDIRNHPAFLSLANSDKDESVPKTLVKEVEQLFDTNKKIFAEYMGWSLDRLKFSQARFSELTRVVDGLAHTTQQESTSSIRKPDEEAEALVVVANKEIIKQTSSASFTKLTPTILKFATNSNHRLGGTFTVKFKTNSGVYGEQQWYANRFIAYPAEDIVCKSEQCGPSSI